MGSYRRSLLQIGSFTQKRRYNSNSEPDIPIPGLPSLISSQAHRPMPSGVCIWHASVRRATCDDQKPTPAVRRWRHPPLGRPARDPDNPQVVARGVTGRAVCGARGFGRRVVPEQAMRRAYRPEEDHCWNIKQVVPSTSITT